MAVTAADREQQAGAAHQGSAMLSRARSDHPSNTTAQPRERLVVPALTGLRFVAAFMVLMGHGSTILPPGAPYYDVGFWILQITWVGMSLFFVLSGFVIWINYAAAFQRQAFIPALRGFMAARVARLYPMYAATIILALAMGALMPALHRLPWPLLTPLMVQGWVPGGGGSLAVFSIAWLGHLWSVSAEMFFYILFPAVALALWRVRSVKGLAAGALVNLLLMAVYFYLAFHYGVRLTQRLDPDVDKQAMMWLTYYAPYPHLFEFIAGCLAGQVFMVLRASPVGSRGRFFVVASAWLLAVGFVCLPLPMVGIHYYPDYEHRLTLLARLSAAALIPLLLIHVSRYPTFLARIMSSRLMLLGGECSYSIYLLHPRLLGLFVFYVGGPYVPTLAEYVFRLAVIACAIPVLAHGSYRLIERPARTYLRRVLGGGLSTAAG